MNCTHIISGPRPSRASGKRGSFPFSPYFSSTRRLGTTAKEEGGQDPKPSSTLSEGARKFALLVLAYSIVAGVLPEGSQGHWRWVSEMSAVDVTLRLRVSLATGSKTGGSARAEVKVAPPSQGKGSPGEMASTQSRSPTRLQALAGPAQAPPPGKREARRGRAAQSPAGVSPVHVVGGGACLRHHSM